MTEVECEYCGELFDKRGIGAHQRHCDGAHEETMTPELDGLEAKARERDDGQCRRCDASERLVTHEVDPDVGQELANVVTLCGTCEAEIEGLHPRTKRTKIRSD